MSAPPVRHRLDRLAAQVRWVRSAGSVAGVLTVMVAAVVLAVVLDHLAPLPGGLRLALLMGLTGLATVSAFRCRAALRRPAPEAIALRIEALAGHGDNALINACQFEATPADGDAGRVSVRAAWLAPTAASAAGILAAVPTGRLLRVDVLLRRCALLLTVLATAGLYAVLWSDHATHGLARLVLPLADLPPLGRAVITIAPAGSLAVPDGGRLTFRVGVRGVDGGPMPSDPPLAMVRTDAPPDVGDTTEGRPLIAAEGGWRLDLDDLRSSCALRCAAGGTWTPLVRIRVDPPPALVRSLWLVDGPAYSGIRARPMPGPPADLVVLPGSTVRCTVTTAQPLPGLRLDVAGTAVAMTAEGETWTGTVSPGRDGDYRLAVPGGITVARGAIRLGADRPPTASLPGAEPNRYADPGTTITVRVAAADDLGLASVAVEVREAVDGATATTLRAWTYLGPPGPQTAAESVDLVLDPARFAPGRTWTVQAVARDRRPPGGQEGRSPPIVVRIRSIADLTVPPGDPRTGAFERLRRCLAEQIRARAAAGTVRANLDDIRAHRSLSRQAQAAAVPQAAARSAGAEAATALDAAGETVLAVRLRPIVDPMMRELASELAGLADDAGLTTRLDGLCARQDEVVARLTALLGQLAGAARAAAPPATGVAAADADRRKAEALAEELRAFIADQRRILDRSRSLAERGGADLGADEQRILGELARSEKEWAAFLEEKLTDFARNPPQDFSDASLSTETNTVWQDVGLAADALTRKAAEMAVPREQSGLELAEKIENNLEKWLANAPDKTAWKMEDAAAPADVPTAELPKELEDIVGELLDKVEAMTPEVQDASSQWMDSIDKGAGWGTGDGPISNMSAKGVTGNVLPNQNEVGGRSGEGRNGRSNGQMVQDAAEGKGGQETPTRLSQTPYESGSVKDSSKESAGGATGGGKLSGFDGEGLRGPNPPPELRQAMARLAGNQQQIRQQAEHLALHLRSQHLPSGGLETAAAALAAAEDAARRFDGRALRQAHTAALDALGEAHRSTASAGAVQVERSRLGPRARRVLDANRREAVPAGYEDMVGRYYQTLAGGPP